MQLARLNAVSDNIEDGPEVSDAIEGDGDPRKRRRTVAIESASSGNLILPKIGVSNSKGCHKRH